MGRESRAVTDAWGAQGAPRGCSSLRLRCLEAMGAARGVARDQGNPQICVTRPRPLELELDQGLLSRVWAGEAVSLSDVCQGAGQRCWGFTHLLVARGPRTGPRTSCQPVQKDACGSRSGLARHAGLSMQSGVHVMRGASPYQQVTSDSTCESNACSAVCNTLKSHKLHPVG